MSTRYRENIVFLLLIQPPCRILDALLVKLDSETYVRPFDGVIGGGEILVAETHRSQHGTTGRALGTLSDGLAAFIVWHDYSPLYEIIDYEVFAGILDGTPIEFRKHLYQVSNTYCAIFTKKNYPTKQLDYPTVPDKQFIVNIKAEAL